MPGLSPLPHLVALALALCLCGVALLLLAAEREGAAVLGCDLRPVLRRRLRLAGTLVLAGALWHCMRLWQPHFGLLLWLGWSSLSCVAAAFAASCGPWRQAQPGMRRPMPRQKPAHAPAAGVRPLRRVFAFALLALPVVFAWRLMAAL